MRTARYLLAAAVLAAVAFPAAAAARSADDSKNLVETAAAAGQFSTLVSLVQKAGLADTLATGTYTVFAPSRVGGLVAVALVGLVVSVVAGRLTVASFRAGMTVAAGLALAGAVVGALWIPGRARRGVDRLPDVR